MQGKLLGNTKDLSVQSIATVLSEQFPNDPNIKQYFTTDIEDIRIGYECQVSHNDGNTWTDFIIVEEDFQRLRSIYKVRTPYLTKDQIEGEGWQTYDKGFTFNKEGFHVWYSETNKLMSIEEGKSPFRKVKYSGTCPSINEFRTICKLLKIK